MQTIFNTSPAKIMHIDLDSCFASIMQQAHPLIRNKPVAVAAYASNNGVILSPSIEAKKLGIKTGMRIFEAKRICSALIVRTPDTALIRDVHHKFRMIINKYCPYVTPKSIDEAVLDFSREADYTRQKLMSIAESIKTDMAREIGEYVRCSIGIGPNRFLAKTAASYKKPNGLMIITHENIVSVYESLSLRDMHGINVGYERRLNRAGIYTPMQFLQAEEYKLIHEVFGGVLGSYWYKRLRGHEVDDVLYGRKSFSHDHSLKQQTNQKEKLYPLLMQLCEKTGRRLRQDNYKARGIGISIFYKNRTYFNEGHELAFAFSTTSEIYSQAKLLVDKACDKTKEKVVKLSVRVFDLISPKTLQPYLFAPDVTKEEKLSEAADAINNKYGEFTIYPLTMGLGIEEAKDAIAFGKSSGISTFHAENQNSIVLQ